MEPERQEHLEQKIDRSDKWFKTTLVVAVILAVGMLGLIGVEQFITQAQIQQGIAANATTGTLNHKKTRAYILCLATYVSIPIENRQESTLTACTQKADTNDLQAKTTIKGGK